MRIKSSSILLHSSLAGCQNNRGFTDEPILIHCFAGKFLTVQPVLRITAFCTGMYKAGMGLSSFRLSRNLFRTLPVVASTNRIIQAVFRCHVLTSSSFKVCVLLELLGGGAVKVVTAANC
jgi:hypothetical protein